MDEGALVTMALAGDQQAFAALVEAYQTPVYNLSYRMLGNAAEAEDAAQEAFVRAYLQLKTYDPTKRFSSWLFSIVAHYCIDQLRRRRFSWSTLESLTGRDSQDHGALDPEDCALSNEEGRELQRALMLLPENYRLVLILRYWQDLSYEEIMAVTRISESALKTRLHRAREMLAEKMRGGRATPAMVQGPVSAVNRKEEGDGALSGC